jgi:hypothetical protein
MRPTDHFTRTCPSRRRHTEDGTEREYVPVEPPVLQPHMERERNRAAAQNRQPLLGSAAYHQLPLGSFSASFQKAAAMDFYITKYQSKPMQSLAPLFMTMLSDFRVRFGLGCPSTPLPT